MPSTDLRGLIPIVPTCFDDDGRLDLPGMGRVVDYLVEVGVHGVAVLGMASEVYSLTDAEREAVITTAAERLERRVPLVVGCSHNSGQAVSQAAVSAFKAGADALMVMPPSMGDASTTVIKEYYVAAAEATDLPIMIQDNPAWTGVHLPIGLYADLCETATIRYAKIETRHPPSTISTLRAAVGDRLAVMGGQAGNWLPEELERGVVGTMPAAIMPQVYLRVLQLWQAGQRTQARAVFHRYHPLIRVTGFPGAGIPMSKVLLAELGLIASPAVRAPLSPLSAQDRDDLLTTMAELNVVDVMRGQCAPVVPQ